MRATVFMVSILLAAGCYEQLKPGRCEKDADCAAGLVCSQEMTAGVFHRCIAVDAGVGGDGGDASSSGCTQDRECSASMPVCGPGGACVGCDTGAADVCATLYPTRRVCAPAGACVECAADIDCPSAAKPACDPLTNVCVACTSDQQCAGRPGPGVCMTHQDGRCASEGETIYVQQSPACTSASDPTAGTLVLPFCGLDSAVVALSSTRRLFVVRGTVQGTSSTIQATAGAPQISVVGQQTAVVAGGASPGLRIAGADVYVRDLRLTRSVDVGISAGTGSILRLERVAVDNNGGGGILLDTSAFELRSVSVTENGPGTLGLATWGGLAIVNPPPGGPARLELLTIELNKGPGLSCTGAIDGAGILADHNSTVDISPTCGIATCGTASPTCGAQ
jgi:hypothetical protein